MKTAKLLLIFFLIAGSLFAQRFGTGLKFNDVKYKEQQTKATLVRSLYSMLPKSASLKAYCPLPKSQGSYGTCVGWATAYCAMTIMEAKKNSWSEKEVITNNTFSPGYIYKQIKTDDDVSCKWGASIEDALEIMKTKGLIKYDDMDEKNCPSYIPLDLFNKAAKYKIKDYAKLFDVGDLDNIKIQSTKKSLSEGKPVVIGMEVPPSFDYPSALWAPTEDYTQSYGGHAMCVIGYDDNMYGGAFEIQNSWGDTWGENGYIWVKYIDYAHFCKYAFEVMELPSSNAPEYTELSGRMKFVTSTGVEMQAFLTGNIYKMNDPYKSGTRFRLNISNNQPAYVYAIGFDGTLKTFQIFPHLPNVSPILNYKQNDVAIPDEEHFIQMDNTVGTDYFCVLYSKDALDIKSIKAKIEAAPGLFADRVKSAVGSKFIDFPDVNYSPNGDISFSAKSTTKNVVALIVEMKHTK